ncbi:MAG: hypothetical protein J6A50_03615 [Clostridia bacterium]|nr:hypothetical protein [Clostridia bacterium]
MKYLPDGYHFFTKIQDNPSKNEAGSGAAGFSLFRKKNLLMIEPFPESLAGLVLAVICDNEKGVPRIHTIGPFRKGPLRYPFSPEMNRIVAVTMLNNGKPVFVSLPKDSGLSIEDVFSRKAEKTENSEEKKTIQNNIINKIPEKLHSFDPFGTTNPAYSWLVCTSEALFKNELTARDITLPVSLEGNALKAITDYKHILFGNYTEEVSKREFFIIGVPTKSQEISCAYNEKYNAARYVEVSYHYGVRTYNGYHLYYVDKKSTALVKVVLKNKNQ